MEMAMKTEMKLANFSMFFRLLTRVKIKNKKKQISPKIHILTRVKSWENFKIMIRSKLAQCQNVLIFIFLMKLKFII